MLKEATCKETGKMEYVCSICNNVVSEKTIEKTPHTVVIDKEVKPTCRKGWPNCRIALFSMWQSNYSTKDSSKARSYSS